MGFRVALLEHDSRSQRSRLSAGDRWVDAADVGATPTAIVLKRALERRMEAGSPIVGLDVRAYAGSDTGGFGSDEGTRAQQCGFGRLVDV